MIDIKILDFKEKFLIFPFVLISLIPLTLITGPAIPDISVTISCIFFIILLLRKKINTSSNIFLYYTLFFWLALLILNLISINISQSISEAFIFSRLLLIPIIMYIWLINSTKLLKLILFIVFFANLIVILDTIFQFLNYHPINGFGQDIFQRDAEIYGRLSGPFLDMVPGSFIAKFFIFGFIFLTLIIKNKKNLFVLSIIYLSLCGLITFISGERMALATFLLGLILLFILIRKYRFIFLISFLFFGLMSFTIYKFHDHFQNYKILESKPHHLGLVIEKFDKNCIDINCSRVIKLQPKLDVVLSNFSKTAYYDAFSLAFEMFKSYPMTGIGMNNFKYGCKNIDQFKRDTCWNHPHNFYLQFLTETGVLGFFLFLFYILLIFKKTFKNFKNDIFNKFSFVSLAIIFWPLMSTGSLFKNWHGIETFFIIGLCLSLTNINNKKSI